MKKYLLLAGLLSTSAFANLHLAPPDFETQNGRAVFVDFKTADYEITYDIKNRKTSVKSRIVFQAEKSGMPLFDLVPKPTSVKINGKEVGQNLITFPGKESKLRQVNEVVTRGEHVLEVTNTFKENVRYNRITKTFSSAFWIRDLTDRLFMEQYIPSNFEFDQYKMTFDIIVKGTKKARQDIYANGVVTKTSPTTFKIEFPEHYTVSCPYFHTTPKNRMSRRDFTYKSVSGRNIPITVYSPNPIRTIAFKKETIRVMKELEADYGAWGHPQFIAYGTFPKTGGMEHAGATATAYGSLDHEMLHSYFAKGVMPANGNSGWIDEALARWRDSGYPRLMTPGFEGSNIGGQSVYKRNTDRRSYALGSAFMAYLDYRLQNIGGLKAFLRGYFQTYNRHVVTTEHFKNNLEFFSGMNFDAEFGQYIWGENSEDSLNVDEHNPHHHALTKSQLLKML